MLPQKTNPCYKPIQLSEEHLLNQQIKNMLDKTVLPSLRLALNNQLHYNQLKQHYKPHESNRLQQPTKTEILAELGTAKPRLQGSCKQCYLYAASKKLRTCKFATLASCHMHNNRVFVNRCYD